MNLGGNRFDRSELAGAFGDLGTLVPFVVGYIAIARLDPQGVLLGSGLLALATGLYFRTPMPVQPMKVIATIALTQPQIVTPGAIFASAVVTGFVCEAWGSAAPCPGWRRSPAVRSSGESSSVWASASFLRESPSCNRGC